MFITRVLHQVQNIHHHHPRGISEMGTRLLRRRHRGVIRTTLIIIVDTTPTVLLFHRTTLTISTMMRAPVALHFSEDVWLHFVAAACWKNVVAASSNSMLAMEMPPKSINLLY